jgi:hypothetical protein
MKNEIEQQIFEKMKSKDFGESMCNETKLKVLRWTMQQLRKHDVISCVCPNEIKTGTVSIHCCNLCGKPDEDWWGKH